MTAREDAYQIVILARQVFDFEDWRVVFTDKAVVLFPTARPEQKLIYESVRDCIDDLRFRRLVRFTSLRDFV